MTTNKEQRREKMREIICRACNAPHCPRIKLLLSDCVNLQQAITALEALMPKEDNFSYGGISEEEKPKPQTKPQEVSVEEIENFFKSRYIDTLFEASGSGGETSKELARRAVKALAQALHDRIYGGSK